MHTYNKNAGLSMIELLVALALSSFLLLGVSTIFLDNKRNYVFQQNQSENIESSRYAFMLMQDQLAKAGYRRRPDVPMDEAYRSSTALGCNFSAGEVAKPFPNTTNGICMRYEPRTDKDRDCLGNSPVNQANLKDAPYKDGKEVIVQRFYLSSNTLICEVAHVVENDVQATQTGELIGGVADLRFEYGVGTAASPQTLNQYTTDPTSPVIAVRYTASLRSTGKMPQDSLSADGHLYQNSQSAIMLRNLMP